MTTYFGIDTVRGGLETNGYLESWDLNNLLPSAFPQRFRELNRTYFSFFLYLRRPNLITYCQQKRNHRLGFAPRSIDSL